MNRYQQQIERVWKEEMTGQEKKAFLEVFLLHENAWKIELADEYRQHLEEDTIYLPAERAALILECLHTKITEVPVQELPAAGRVIQLVPVLKWAAVVAITLVTVLYLNNRQRPVTEVVQVRAPQGKLTLQTNYTATSMQLVLEDSSVITLAPGSAVRYYIPFVNNKRDISLQGQAWFKVAKDAGRPFTVYADNITTTALGTAFMVNTRVKDKVEIRLFEGKVVIRSVDTAFTMKEVYLAPGEMFNIDKLRGQYAVKRFENDIPVDNIVKEMIPVENAAPVAALDFTQQPLKDVLTAIGKRYKVRFVYDATLIANEQVTGTFLPSDSLNTVLSILGTVNGLSFTVHKNVIHVSKIK